MKKSDINEVLKDIAHQWKQPLSRINSNIVAIDCILAQYKIEDPRLKKHLEDIESMTEYMANTMQDFIDTTKKKNLFFIQEPLEEAKNLLYPTLEDKEIKLHLSIEENFSCYGTSNDFLQVILILINNAKDALLERNIYPPVIELRVFKENEIGSIQVIDNAGGMTKTAMEKIFEPSYTSKHSSEGSGLGLDIAKRVICEHFYGDISVKNFNKGTCFHITLNTQASKC